MEHVTEQQLTRRQSTVWRALRAAAPQTIPVLAGYFVLGMGYGIYVQSLGLPVWMPMLMGTVVYGGSLEFVLASLLLSAFSPLSAFLMALMIQARHLFYGLAMLERYKGYGLRSFYMIFAMSDETFSIHCAVPPPEGVDRGWFMFFVTLLSQIYWVGGATAGALLGTMVTRFLPFLIFPEGKEPPEFIQYLGKVLPYAVIGLLVIYCLKDVPGSGTYGIPEFLAIVFIVLLHRWKKNILLSIGGGTVFYMLLVQFVFCK